MDMKARGVSLTFLCVSEPDNRTQRFFMIDAKHKSVQEREKSNNFKIFWKGLLLESLSETLKTFEIQFGGVGDIWSFL